MENNNEPITVEEWDYEVTMGSRGCPYPDPYDDDEYYAFTAGVTKRVRAALIRLQELEKKQLNP